MPPWGRAGILRSEPPRNDAPVALWLDQCMYGVQIVDRTKRLPEQTGSLTWSSRKPIDRFVLIAKQTSDFEHDNPGVKDDATGILPV